MTHLNKLLSDANWPAPEIALEIASDEIERLLAGGCARDQGTTQYCAEAARMAARITELEKALKKIYEQVTECFKTGRANWATNAEVILFLLDALAASEAKAATARNDALEKAAKVADLRKEKYLEEKPYRAILGVRTLEAQGIAADIRAMKA